MSLSNGELSAADVAAVVGNGNNGGFGNWGDGSIWILVLFILALVGGWNNNGNGGGGNNGVVQQGFDQAAIMNQLGQINSSICGGFAGAEASANARQIADMQQSFANQAAINQAFYNLSSQFANCCCENRLATANLGADIAREACAGRAAVSDAVASLLTAFNSGVQSIKDQICQDKIDAKDDIIANLRQQIQMQQLAASERAQTQTIVANNDLQTAALEQYLAPPARPAYIVQNPNCCAQNFYNGTGCGYGM